jgi:hypothetical protein
MSVRSKDPNNHIIDFRENGRKSRRHQIVFRGTRLEALSHERQLRIMGRGLKDINIDLHRDLFPEAINFYKVNSDKTTAKEIEYVANLFVNVMERHHLLPFFALSPPPEIFICYTDERSKIVSATRVNRELLLFRKMHDYWVSRNYCDPLPYDLTRFYLKDRKEHVAFSEHFFEKIIEMYPSIFLGEILTNVKPPSTSGYIPDSLFIDENENYVVVEIQRERLDRIHAYKILEYRDKLEAKMKDYKIRMMEVIIGSSVPADRDTYLTKYGVELKVLPLKEIEGKILNILKSKDAPVNSL